MKHKILVLITCFGFGLLYLASGCEEGKISSPKPGTEQITEKQATPVEGKAEISREKEQAGAEIKPTDTNTPQKPVKGPAITFETTTIDLGVVGTSSTNNCEYKFTSTGTETLVINNVRSDCGCTTAKLEKTKYEPNESGSIKVTYHAGTYSANDNKTLYAQTNAATNPNIPLTIKATVKKKVEAKPDRLSLSLKQPNAGCPELTLKSLDNVAFAIKKIQSTADCITIPYDPCQVLTTHSLKPEVDTKKLEQILSGNIQFSLTHPQCNTVDVSFTAPAEYITSPPTLLILNAQPEVPTIRDQIWVINNYGETFEIKSVHSEKGYVKNLSIEKAETGRYALKLEITPPKIENNARNFVDTVIVKTNTGKEVKITCRGYYKR